MNLGEPLALLILPAGLAAFAILARNGLRPGIGAPLLLRCLVFTLVVLALARPVLRMESHARHVTWVVDESVSMGGTAAAAAAAFSERAGLPPGDQSMVAFDGTPRMETAPDHAPAKAATNIAQALLHAAASSPSGKSPVLVLFTDGAETKGDAVAAVRALAEDGARIFAVPVRAADRADARVVRLDVPAGIRAREPFEVSAVVVSDRGGPAAVEWTIDGLRAESAAVNLRAGEQSFRSTHNLPAGGSARIGFRIAGRDDPVPENDSLESFALAGGEPAVLLISAMPRPPLAGALASQGIRCEVRPPAGLPANPDDYASFEAVVLDGVPDIPADSGAALARAVAEGGCGLLVTGGPEASGPAGLGTGALAGLLPVTSDFETERELPGLALVAAIDRSGSMKGEKLDMAKSAVRAAFAVLSPQDSAGLVAFDSEAAWVVPLAPSADLQDSGPRISSIAAGGGTNIAAGLELALAGLRSSNAKLRHIILLSDGISTPGPFEAITSDLAASGITLSTVGLGAEADTSLLEALARDGGGRFYFTDSPDSVPQIFAKDALLASRPPFLEEPFEPVVARRAAFLDAETAFPALLGFSLARPKPESDVWLEAPGERPLLATWRTGLAKVGVFTSDTGRAWASEWVRWPGYAKFWAGVLRELFRPRDLAGTSLSAARSDGRLRVEAAVTGKDGRPLPGAGGSLSFAESTVALQTAGPGLLTAGLESDEAGLATASITVPGGGPAMHTIPVPSSYPAEFLFADARPGFFEELARAGGGTVGPAPEEIANAAVPPRRHAVELWPLLLMLAAVAFVGDVAVRRLR